MNAEVTPYRLYLNIFEHNLPFQAAAHMLVLCFRRMFPDSEIAKK